MESRIHFTIDINAQDWEKIKEHSGLTEDSNVFLFLHHAGEIILEAVVRESRILEVNEKSGEQTEIYFADLLNQYALSELIRKAESGDVASL